jgi:hypothetical protein
MKNTVAILVALVLNSGLLFSSESPLVRQGRRNGISRTEHKVFIWYRASGIEAFRIKGLKVFGGGMYNPNGEESENKYFIDSSNRAWCEMTFNALDNLYNKQECTDL